MAGLVGLLAVEGEVKKSRGSAGFDDDAFISKSAAEPGSYPYGNIDTDKVVRRTDRQLGQLRRTERQRAGDIILQGKFVPRTRDRAKSDGAGCGAVIVYSKAKAGVADISGQRAGRKGGETELEKGAPETAVSLEDTQIDAAAVIGAVRRRFPARRAVVDISVLQKERFNRSSAGGEGHDGKTKADNDGRAGVKQ